jgi:hypothetical protein
VSDILPGPITIISRAIEARLRQVMPPNKFTYQWLPAKMDKTVWDLLIRRTPSVSLEYLGFERAENASTLMGTALWNVWLAVKNIRSAEAGLFGDDLTPQGALIVHQVAMVALHGMVVPGAGTVVVVKAEPASLKDRDDPGVFTVFITLKVDRLGIALTDLLGADIINAGTVLTEVISWSFGDSAEIVQTDTITNTGTS